MKNIFLTGGTGLAGCNIIQEALIKDINIYTITRGENAESRTKDIMRSAFQKQNYTSNIIDKLISKLHIFPVSWESPEETLLSLKGELLRKNIQLDSIIHCASDMTYSRMNIFLSYNQNVLATSKLYDFFTENSQSILNKNARFYFYSTAYSCGIKNEKNNEEIHINANAPSVYHLTKSYIEKELWIKTHYNCHSTVKLPITIIRPSGIIGRSDNGDFGNHLIGLADVLSIFKKYSHSNKHITLDIDGNNEINFVPANIIAKWNIDLIEQQNNMTEIYNILHFTALQGITKDDLFKKISDLYKISISSGIPQTEEDIIINKKLKKHKLYLENEWHFSRNNLNKYLNLSDIKDNFDILNCIEKIYPAFKHEKEDFVT